MLDLLPFKFFFCARSFSTCETPFFKEINTLDLKHFNLVSYVLKSGENSLKNRSQLKIVSQTLILRVRPRKNLQLQEGPFFQIQNGLHYHLPYLRDAQK